MFETYKTQIEEQLTVILQKEGIQSAVFQWSEIPFSGHWGISTSFFQIAAQEAKSGKKINVPQRAAELASLCASALKLSEDFEKCEAVKGYLNLYFQTQSFSRMVVDRVLDISIQEVIDAGKFHTTDCTDNVFGRISIF